MKKILISSIICFGLGGCHQAQPSSTAHDPPREETTTVEAERRPSDVRVVQLENADAGELSNTLMRLAVARRQEGRPSALVFTGVVNIVAHHPTNSLLIVSNDRDFEVMNQLIGELDVPTIWERRSEVSSGDEERDLQL